MDLACGSGLYGKYLKTKCDSLIGLDKDPVLCENAERTGYYERIYCEPADCVGKLFKGIDIIFCSEFLEHVTNDCFVELKEKIESICIDKIVITVPNPLSPHFKVDPTHVLKYTIYSLLKVLNKSQKFQYKLYPLGFSEYNLKKTSYIFLNVLSKRISILSPTVLYVGKRIKSEHAAS